VHQDLLETVRAEVLEILSEGERDIIGTDSTAIVQEVRVRILQGVREGEETVFENDLVPLEAGDRIFVNRLETIGGVEYFQFKDVNRIGNLFFLGILFVVVLVIFAGKQGARAFVSLLGSIAAILFILVPLLLNGYPPVLTSVAVAGVILALALFITHGINARSVTAFGGTFGAVVATGIIATVWVKAAHLTGLSSDASVYLNFGTGGRLDFAGLLLGSIIIGVLGILDDVAITQASVVQELKAANATLPLRELYSRAIRVGRDHVGSLVNTLALAYIGAALPLVLLMVESGAGVILSVNQEIVASELVRILVGSIGLILAVPFTTVIAAWWYDTHEPERGQRVIDGHVHRH
jgi:uncharacterized membrane protein